MGICYRGKRRVPMKKYLTILLLCSLLLCTGCRRFNPDNWNTNKADSDFAATNAMRTDISVNEKGIFYISGAYLFYYDYASDDSFILCSKLGCTHLNSECVANAGLKAVGFALVDDYGYYFRPVPDSLCWECVKVDFQNQTYESICTLGKSEVPLDTWSIDSVQSVYYNQGHAWVKLRMLYHPSEPTGWSDYGIQMISVDLSSGQVHEYTEPLMDNRDYSYAAWKLFDENHVVYWFEEYESTPMNSQEYEQIAGNDDPNGYTNYLNSVNENIIYSYRVIDIDTYEQTILTRGKEEDCPVPVWFADGKWVVEANDYQTKSASYYYLNEDGQLSEEIFHYNNGGLLAWFMGEASFRLYDGNFLLYLTYEGEDRCKIYKYSIETGESTFLFEDDRGVSFRITGQTSDKLVGKINDDRQFAWIYKKDYESGNFKAFHKFHTI